MKRSAPLVVAVLTFVPSLLLAQDAGQAFRDAFLAQLGDVEKKLVDLAEAMPADKYSWRPMEGVRSVSEVYMHVSEANYTLPSMAGVKPPGDLDRSMEKAVTEKPKVVEELKKSFAYIRKVMMEVKDEDLLKPAKFFGQETTVLGVYLNIANHMHEHLGQSIAYARMNHIVPPWTAARQAAEKKKSEK